MSKIPNASTAFLEAIWYSILSTARNVKMQGYDKWGKGLSENLKVEALVMQLAGLGTTSPTATRGHTRQLFR